MLVKDQEDMVASHVQEVEFLRANVLVLQGNHSEAKDIYKNCLRTVKNNRRTAMILNNLAYSSW